MPVVDAVIVTVLPDDGHRVGADRDHVDDTRGGSVAQLFGVDVRIRFGLHILGPAAAGGAATGGAQLFERVHADMPVVPGDGEFPLAFVGGDAGGFFVHVSPCNVGQAASMSKPTNAKSKFGSTVFNG